MVRKYYLNVFNIGLFIVLLAYLFLPGIGFCQCGPPQESDYTQAGRVYIGDTWEYENYMLIENTSDVVFKNVNTRFYYGEWRRNSFEEAFGSFQK